MPATAEPASSFERLCAEAERRGERVGLHVGRRLHVQQRADGSQYAWREIVGISVRSSGNAVLKSVRIEGLDDLERGAAVLLKIS